MIPFQAVVFDLDYTLVDCSRGIIDCINSALGQLDLPPVSAERARQTIGLSLPDVLVELAGPGHTAKANEFSRLFIERADQVILDLTVFLDGVPHTVALLRARGYSLGILSNKLRRRMTDVLERANLLGSFDAIVGIDDVSQPKPDPEGLLVAMRALGSSAPSTLYVGDSATDAETATRAQVSFVAVLSGVTPRVVFDQYDTLAVLEDVSALPGLLACGRNQR